MTTTPVAERLARVAATRGWWLPAASAAATVAAFTGIVWSRDEVDLRTYLMGGAHAFSPDLYNLRFPVTHLGFTYPPFSALLFVPLSHLPVRLDTVAFTWLGLACLFGLLAVCLRATCPILDRRALVWWALLLMAPAVMIAPVRETLMFGQINLVLALAVIADMTLDLRIGKGLLVGLAAAIKLTPLILIPYLFLTRRPRAGGLALAAFAGAGIVAAAASPRASWTYWSHDAWLPTRAGSLRYVSNQSVVGVIARLDRQPLGTLSTFVIVAAVSVIGLTVALFAHRRSAVMLGFLVVEATESLASPVSWDHHYVWIVLLIMWLALGADRPAHGAVWAAVVAVIFWTAPIWWAPHGGDVRYGGQVWLFPLADSFFFVLVAVVAATALQPLRDHRGRRRSVQPSGVI